MTTPGWHSNAPAPPPPPMPPRHAHRQRRWLIIGGLAVVIVLAIVLPLTLTGGSSSPSRVALPTVTTAPDVPTTPAPTTRAPTDPNIATCVKVHTLALRVKSTFDKWKPNTNEFDQAVARQMRSEGTRMFALAAQATGATRSAIIAEATGLTKMSVAINVRSDSELGNAANGANTALARLRGTCNF